MQKLHGEDRGLYATVGERAETCRYEPFTYEDPRRIVYFTCVKWECL